MAEEKKPTKKVKMKADWIVLGEKWSKGKTYDAEQREVDILLGLEKAELVTDVKEADHA